ncbi:MAG: response regulator, partial [Acidobacteriaceae bacterium]|nr:response regulator [Acidobacteriaceae bacterium]
MTKRPMILVADDEPLVADTLVQILQEEGYDAIAVSDGAAAVQFARQGRPQIVVCDVIMPTMNGIDAARAIREFLPETHIILFSGQAAAAGLIERAASEGYEFDVLAKPIKPDVL